MEAISAEPSVFDLSRFNSVNGDDLTKIFHSLDHLQRNTIKVFNPEDIRPEFNPFAFYCKRIEGPAINSHGEHEVLVTHRRALGDNRRKGVREEDRVPAGALLCIDIQNIFSEYGRLIFPDHGRLLVYGNIRSSEEAGRYVPGNGREFIELGALQIHVPRSRVAVYGKGLSLSAQYGERELRNPNFPGHLLA
jgi:hypothetical protein